MASTKGGDDPGEPTPRPPARKRHLSTAIEVVTVITLLLQGVTLIAGLTGNAAPALFNALRAALSMTEAVLRAWQLRQH